MAEPEDDTQIRVSHFNFDRMYRYLGEDKESIREILLLVIEELKTTVQKLEHYIFDRRLEDIRDTAHKLVGTASSVGLEQLCTTARKIEQINQFDSEILYALFAKFKYQTKLVTKIIKSYLINT